MLRMILRPGRVLSAALALGALTAAGAWASAGAQETRPRIRVESRDCRCVDKDGNEIENCTCFTTPDVGGILARVLPLRESRARLGITITEELDEDDASLGVRIDNVLEGGPADDAGLREGDVITALDGKSLLRPLDREMEEDFDLDGSIAMQRLMALVREVEPGAEVRVDYLRDGEAHTTTVTAEKLDNWGVGVVSPRWRSGDMAEAMDDLRGRLREFRFERADPSTFELRLPDAPDAPEVPRAPRSYMGVRSPNFVVGWSGACPGGSRDRVVVAGFSSRCVAGVALEELNPKLGEYFGTTEGVLVTDVDEESTLGLQPGDVILEIGDRDVTDPDRVRRILGTYDDDEAITLRIMRQKREMSVQGTLSR